MLSDKVIGTVVILFENNEIQFDFGFKPGGPEPAAILTSLYEYLTLMLKQQRMEDTKPHEN